MGYQPSLSDIGINSNQPSSGYRPSLSDLGAQPAVAATQNNNNPPVAQNNVSPPRARDLFTPLMSTPSSVLQQTGNVVAQTPVGRLALETTAAIPFGLAEAPEFIASQAAKLPGVPGYLANLAGVIGKNISFGVGANEIPTSDNQGQSVEEKAKNAVLPSAIGAAIAKPVLDIASYLKPSYFLRGNLSPEDLQSNLQATQGTNTSLGDVVASPFLKRQYENVFTKFPFSGANEKLQQTGQQVLDKGNAIVNNYLKGTDPGELTDLLSNNLRDIYNSRNIEKNALYTNANNIANNSGLKLSLPNFSQAAQKYSDALNNTTMLKYEPDSKFLMNKLVNYQNPTKDIKSVIVDQSGNPLTSKTQYPTLQEANLLKGKLNDYAEQYKVSPNPDDRNLANVFSNLSSNLKKDISNSIDASGNNNLRNAYDDAESNYKNNFSTLLDKNLYKFISGSADPDTIISSFLKNSRVSDRSNLLNTLLSTMPDSSRQLFQGAFLSRALDNQGELNPSSLNLLIKNLGRNQLKTLFPDEAERNSLQDYRKLYQMNTKAVNMMSNPATGQQNMDLLPLLLAHGLGAAGGATAGEHEGGMGGGILGAIAGASAPGLALRPLVNYLSSPEIRNSLINEMINPSGISPASHYLMGLTTNAMNENKK